jgi:hypothetical protein|tara:strand:- start:81 stop:302 length:222 start_codon:yes stop_codon:yes gene_type:complete
MGKNRDKFVELAENRVSRVVKDIRLIGNLSNRTNYSYTDEDVKKIVSTLKSEISKLQKRFETSVSLDEDGFKL